MNRPPPNQMMENGNDNVDAHPMDYQEDSSPLHKVLDELNMSILPHDLRLSAILKASQLFDHRDRTKHDYELHEGAAKILYQKLAFVLTLQLSNYDSTSSYNMPVTSGFSTDVAGANIVGQGADGANLATIGSHNSVTSNTSIVSMQRMRSTRSAQASDADYELTILSACLEMVHRASNESIAHTWHSIGHEALPILIKLLERPFHKIQIVLARAQQLSQSANTTERNIAQAVNRENKLTVQKITKILAVYSLIPEAKVLMAACPGLLPILVKITDTHNLNRMKSMRPISKRMMMQNNPDQSNSAYGTTPTLGGNGVQGTTAGAGLYMTEAARFNAIAILTNLAAVEQNRMLMLSEPGLVDNIARVVHNERSDVARQCSALAIMNLSNGDRDHVPELAGNDLILETIIKLIRDDDPETRRNAAISLFNIACADQNTVKLVRYKDGLILDVLIQCVSSDDDDSIDILNDIKVNAAEALFNISCSSIEETTDKMASHAGLLETLAVVLRNPVGSKDVKLYCAATLRRMAEIVHYPKRSQLELLSALVKAAVWTRTACIAEAFLSQSRFPDNRPVLVEHNGLLNALSKQALTPGGSEAESIRKTAVSAIEHLSREVSVRQILSQHEGIMLAMTRASIMSSSGTEGSNRSLVSGQDDDPSAASSSTSTANRRLQMALKHLVGAM